MFGQPTFRLCASPRRGLIRVLGPLYSRGSARFFSDDVRRPTTDPRKVEIPVYLSIFVDQHLV